MQISDGYYKPIEKDLQYYFYELYYKEIMEAFKDPYFKMNSNNSIISAIRSGKIQYKNGIFTGKFNMKISSSLEQFAKYDGRSKTWVGKAPPSILAASIVANDKSKALNEKINNLIDQIPEKVASVIESLKYSIDAPLFAMNKQAAGDLKSLGIEIDVTPELSARIKKEYTTNMDINIVNWTDKQTENLREVVQKNVLSGYNRNDLIKMISNQYDVTMTKAGFLARQETSLLMSTIRNDRYQDGGIKIVKWLNSHDIRVVGTPGGTYPDPTKGHGNHYLLGNKYCRLDDPTLYADSLEDAKNNKWKSKANIGAGVKHAGEEYYCRCAYQAIIV